MRAPSVNKFVAVMIAVWLIRLIAVQLEARNEKAPAPTNFWHQQSTGRRDSTNMPNVTLERLVSLLTTNNVVTLTLDEGMVHVRVLPR